jgi:hypothetical protein
MDHMDDSTGVMGTPGVTTRGDMATNHAVTREEVVTAAGTDTEDEAPYRRPLSAATILFTEELVGGFDSHALPRSRQNGCEVSKSLSLKVQKRGPLSKTGSPRQTS